MGFISRKIFPACGSMCVCCPALRSRSRQPVKRYKKLLQDIFPKYIDGPPNERKIAKLCEYAAKNPVRIPKIAKCLEERFHRELRHEHTRYINVIADAYSKLLCICKEQMAYFAVSLLNVATELLDQSKDDTLRILGCQMLTRLIISQVAGTYARNIENLVCKVCMLAHESGEEDQKRRLRASSLQCLSEMIWFMGEYSNIFPDFEEIVHAVLDNYEPATRDGDDDERGEPHHHWVDEVVRCEGRGASVCSEISPISVNVRPRPEKKDPSRLTGEEIETPKVWAQICIERMADLAKESSTMRCMLDPMFIYFDLQRHWAPHQGLALIILSDLSYFAESSGNQQLILASVIRHLDHKNVAHDPQLKSYVIQVATALARQIRTSAALAETGFVSDLCRHLRKSLQATLESYEEQELNIILQNSIEDCLLEIAEGMDDSRPLYDMMVIVLEKLAPARVVAKATIGSLMILAHVISLASVTACPRNVFPEALLVQLLKAMLHPDIDARIGAHQLFSLLLTPSSYHRRHEVSSKLSTHLHEPRKWRSDASSTFASVTALLEKLRREKNGNKVECSGNNICDDSKERDNGKEDCKWGHPQKNSPTFCNISSIMDKRAGSPNLAETEPLIMKFTDDQIIELLSGFWMQSTLPDNMPSNIESIAHSFSLTLASLRLKNPNDNIAVRFFQLPLSLRRVSLDSGNGSLSPACQRSILILSTGMLMFAAKVYQIPRVSGLLKTLISDQVDPFLVIGDDLQIYIKPQVDLKKFGSFTDNQQATSLLLDLQSKVCEMDNIILDILVQRLSSVTELEADAVANLLREAFMPDDSLILGPHSVRGLEHNYMASHSKESLSSDGEFPTNSAVEDDASSEPSAAFISQFIQRVPSSPSSSHIIGIGQLLESALEVASQVAGASASTSPLPYDTMAGQCEALGAGTRKKLSNWLACEYRFPVTAEKPFPVSSTTNSLTAVKKITNEDESIQGVVKSRDPWMAMKLPPASPFDNFLKAAGC